MERCLRTEISRVKKALNESIIVPFEFSKLGSSRQRLQEEKIYLYSELESLGIRMIHWDGL